MSQEGDVESHGWYYFWLIHHTSHGRSWLLISLHYIIPRILKMSIFRDMYFKSSRSSIVVFNSKYTNVSFFVAELESTGIYNTFINVFGDFSSRLQLLERVSSEAVTSILHKLIEQRMEQRCRGEYESSFLTDFNDVNNFHSVTLQKKSFYLIWRNINHVDTQTCVTWCM